MHIVIRADEGLVDSLDCVVATQDTIGFLLVHTLFQESETILDGNHGHSREREALTMQKPRGHRAPRPWHLSGYH